MVERGVEAIMIGKQGSRPPWVRPKKQLRHFSAYQPIYHVSEVCSGGVATLCNIPLILVVDPDVDGSLPILARSRRGVFFFSRWDGTFPLRTTLLLWVVNLRYCCVVYDLECTQVIRGMLRKAHISPTAENSLKMVSMLLKCFNQYLSKISSQLLHLLICGIWEGFPNLRKHSVAGQAIALRHKDLFQQHYG